VYSEAQPASAIDSVQIKIVLNKQYCIVIIIMRNNAVCYRLVIVYLFMNCCTLNIALLSFNMIIISFSMY